MARIGSRIVKSVAIYYSFARSGGTLLNKCLGCDANNIVLSEINPAGFCLGIADQANKWFGLISDAELDSFRRLSYVEQIAHLTQICQARGKMLIIRDWTALNFLEGVHPLWTPSRVLEQEYYFAGHDCKIRAVVFARRSDQVYSSIKSQLPQFHHLGEEDFSKAYRDFACSVAHWPVFRFEEFTEDPRGSLKSIAEHLACGYAENFHQTFFHYEKCTGNNTLSKSQDSNKWEQIKPSKESRSFQWTNKQARLICLEADQLLGYE